MACAKFIVSGKVQGVFFRASTRTRALQLDLHGYAKNLPNGNVEVLACGDAASLDALEEWLRIGPPSATVERVLRTASGESPPSGFVTL